MVDAKPPRNQSHTILLICALLCLKGTDLMQPPQSVMQQVPLQLTMVVTATCMHQQMHQQRHSSLLTPALLLLLGGTCCYSVLVTENERRIFDAAIAMTLALLLLKLCLPRLYAGWRAAIVFSFHIVLTTLRA
jgi:hypothetical protein